MVNGDLAAAEAGFVPVLPAEDFRLGYDGINRAADLAVRRGVRNVTSASALTAIASPYVGQFAVRSDTRITYRWDGTSWRPWESAWYDWTTAWQGLVGSYGASPGWISGGRWRYSGGAVRALQSMYLNGGAAGSTGAILASLPVPSDQFNPNGQRMQDGYASIGAMHYVQAANGRQYQFAIGHQDANTIRFGRINTAQYVDGVGGAGFGQSDQFRFVVEYDPA